MLLEVVTTDYFPAKAANDTTTGSYASRVPTVTEPTNDGVLTFNSQPGGPVQNGLLIVPFGVGADTTAFNFKVLGWRRAGRQPSATGQAQQIWVPVTLCEMTAAISLQTGVTGTIVPATNNFCDTITAVTGTQGTDLNIVSPADDTNAHLTLALRGFPKVEFIFLNTTTTSANCLVALL